jgi:hypothetical protein
MVVRYRAHEHFAGGVYDGTFKYVTKSKSELKGKFRLSGENRMFGTGFEPGILLFVAVTVLEYRSCSPSL